MNKITSLRGKAAIVSGTVLLAGLGLGATGGAAAAAPQGDTGVQVSCYGQAKSYTKAAGRHTTSVFRTTSNCNDINIKTNTSRYVKVCFKLSNGDFDCQSSYKLASAGSWKVIATNVRNSQQFVFYFQSTSRSTGSYAA
ncbi:hypothetical protein [Streptomyces pratensis]|uniref:hypothetical protein n=1 Tax=Streptomyces pratensis TaxID=1169025 RepID=UPI0030195010